MKAAAVIEADHLMSLLGSVFEALIFIWYNQGKASKASQGFISPSLIYIFLLHYLELVSFKHNLSISGHHLSNTHLNRKKNEKKKKKKLSRKSLNSTLKGDSYYC